MLVFYTIFYLFLLYMGYSFYLFTPQLLGIVSLLREGYILLLIFYSLYYFFEVRKTKLSLTKTNILFFVQFFLSLPFLVLTNNTSQAITTFILFISGPLIFFMLSNLRISSKTKALYDFSIKYFVFIVCIISCIMFFFQNSIYASFTDEIRVFYRTADKMRLVGLGSHPTTTGFLFLFCIAFYIFAERKIIRTMPLLYFFNLSGTRSAFFGLPFYIFFKSSPRIRKLLFAIGCIFILIIYELLVNDKLMLFLDGSALAHLFHLLVQGPEWALALWYGKGWGSVSPYNTENPIVHLESDLYLYSIQVGIISLILSIIIFIILINKLKRMQSKKANYLLFVFLTYLSGCLVFPIHDMRFISNFIWIELGMEFSYLNGGKKYD